MLHRKSDLLHYIKTHIYFSNIGILVITVLLVDVHGNQTHVHFMTFFWGIILMQPI